MQDAINLLVMSAKPKRLFSKDLNAYFRFRVNFITLTLPSAQVHTDKEIHNKIFKDFIRTWKRSNPNLLYIYKAEVQDSGNLHYHLTTNSFIHFAKLRKWWNRSCNLLGYLDRCTTNNPNSTDVHAVKNIKNIAAYLCTYISKKDIYKKPLKRYLRRYKKQLLDNKESVFHLPKNYFQNFKRKVNLKLWDASKALLSKPLVLNLSAGTIPHTDIYEIEKSSTLIKQYDYCKVLYLNTFALSSQNTVLLEYKKYIKEVEEITENAVHILENV